MASFIDASDFTDNSVSSDAYDAPEDVPKTRKQILFSSSAESEDLKEVIEESFSDSNHISKSTGAVRKSVVNNRRTSTESDDEDNSHDASLSTPVQNTSDAFTSYRDNTIPFPKKKRNRRPLIESDSESDDDCKYEAGSESTSESESDNIINISKKKSDLLLQNSWDEAPVDDAESQKIRNRYTDMFRSARDDILSSTRIERSPTQHNSSVKINSLRNSASTMIAKDSRLSNGTILKANASDQPNSSSVLLVTSEEEDEVVDISSGEDYDLPVRTPHKTPVKKIERALNRTKQVTLNELISKNNLIKQEGASAKIPTPVQMSTPKCEQNIAPIQIEVSQSELRIQEQKVNTLQADLLKAINIMRSINLKALPDGGKLVIDRHAALETRLKAERDKLEKMVVTKEDPLSNIEKVKKIDWEDIQADANAVMPRTFGTKAMSTYNAQKALTMDRLQQLHGSLATCPKEDELAEDPKGLKVELMPHQRRALTWLMWREKQKPSGGILADDMGLGKTLTMISLMLKTKEVEIKGADSEDIENQPERTDFKHQGGTLVICPASLIQQWSGELERRTKRGLASFELYHGPKRETNPKILGEYDMVITTYSIANNEADRRGAIYKIRWRRIVLDEAHQIRNYKSQTSEAVCKLSAKSRWTLTGTPVQNKELDMYALLKFLRCTPFDDLQVWKRWVGDKTTGGTGRLHTVISSLMLRRTKTELMDKGSLNCLPEKKWELVPVELQKNEMAVYQKVLIFSRTLFAQFLHQRAEKNQDAANFKFTDVPKNAPNEEYFKMRSKLLKFNKVKDVSQHEILVLLLRLRQICNHPTLITAMLNDDVKELGSDDEMEELNLLDQLNKLNIEDDQHNSFEGIAEGGSNAMSLKDASKGFLNPSNPVFSDSHLSSKIGAVMKMLQERLLNTEDKAVVVSQWTGFLRIVAKHLKNTGIEFDQLDGSVPVNKRMNMVDAFNNPKHKMKVLLLSLTAGGVGLNLVGANHLFLLDLHWNPQLENQAQDRIYRVGQRKPVYVYKFMATDTIEERIKGLQEIKLDIANAMLTGSKQVIQNKLSLQDLKMLFDM